MYPVNRFPRGLLGFLDSKVQGQTPQALAAVIQGQLDLSHFYHAQMREVLFGVTPNVGAGGTSFATSGNLTGPTELEMWYVHRFSIEANTAIAAGQHIVASPAIETRTAVGPTDMQLVDTKFVANQIGWFTSSGTVQPFWMLPGDVFIVRVDSLSGIVTSFNGVAHISRVAI